VLKQRVVTAVILVALLLGALLWSPFAFAIVMAVAFALAQAEWLRLAGWRFATAAAFSLAIAALLSFTLLARPQLLEIVTPPLVAVATVIWAALGGLLVQSQRKGRLVRVPASASTLLAVILTSAAWCALMTFLDVGVVTMLSVLLIVWLADTAAYFSGRAFGRAKLASVISPGKTWAGVWGAMAAVAALALAADLLWPEAPLYSTLLLDRLGIGIALPLLALLVALSIVGDLFESLLKRQAGAKDSGHLLPGHGGFFDRLDAMLALLPPAALFWKLAG
jgi:phosphatidate cytidylyltransferase